MLFRSSRYYDPAFGRFINADDANVLVDIGFDSIGSLNLYVYCGNNPVMGIDPSGYFVLTSFLIGLGLAGLIGAGIGAVSYVAAAAITYCFTGDWTWSWGMFLGSVLGGAITGSIDY